MLVKFLPGSYDTFEPAGIPFLYCGLLSLILLPVYFVSRKISPREKVASAAIVAFLIFSLIFNPVDLVWHGFSAPNWLNGRYSFLLCFFILVLAYKAFGNIKSVSEKFLLVVMALLLLFVAVAEKFELESFINSDSKLLTLGCVWFSIVFLIATLVLLCLRVRIKNPKTTRNVSAVLAALICLEVFCNGVVCFMQIHEDVHFTSYSGYQNFIGGLRPVVEEVKEYDGGFYRMEKTYFRKTNDNMALNIRGLSGSASTLNKETIQFLNKMGYSSKSHWSKYLGGNPVSDSLLGLKYLIAESAGNLDDYYEIYATDPENSYLAYYNPYALSLAYGVDEDILDFPLGFVETMDNKKDDDKEESKFSELVSNFKKKVNEWLDIDSVMLSKLDGDARGGAALSIRAVVNKPIKFVGTGEKLDAVDQFHPSRMADRILGMGDIVSLVERAQERKQR